MKDAFAPLPATGDYTPPQDPPATPPIDSSPPQGFDSQNDPYRTGFWDSSAALEDTTTVVPEIPGFVLEKELGRGGMGVVYRARQLPLNRLVALKMILAGDHASTDAKTRFLAEAEAIAKVQHPGIVQVHAFGTHQGNPYFALEYIDGGSLDRVLSKGPLLPQDAARLVAQLAEAIQAAHAKGIVHRDLKPANVLLSFSRAPEARDRDIPARAEPAEARASGARLNEVAPKITDFGLAKQIDAGPGLTATGMIMGTPTYMAPEQAAGLEVGPAMDQYALGAILYECLTGRPPFQGVTIFDTFDMIMHREPIPVRQLQPKTPKDLETICLKCLRKAPARRYPSTQALADDLRDFLDGKPIAARPVGRLERTWKWCRRYPTVAASLLVATLAALLASGLAAWAVTERDEKELQRQRAVTNETLASDRLVVAEAEKKKAEEENRIAQAVRDFLRFKLLAQGDPWKQADRLYVLGQDVQEVEPDPKFSVLLGRAVAELAPDKIEASFPHQPLVQAELLLTVGDTYRSIGGKDRDRYALAIDFLERAAHLRQRHLGPDHPDTLTARHNLALAYAGAGKRTEAIRLFEQVRAGFETKFGPDHPDTLSTLDSLAQTYLDAGKVPEAIRLFEQVRAASEIKLGPDHVSTLATLNSLGIAYQSAGKLPEAIRLFEQVRVACEAKFGPDHPRTLATLDKLAGAYVSVRKLPEAIQLYEQVRAAFVTHLGPDHPATLKTLNNLAVAYANTKKWPEAIQLYEQVRAVFERQLGPDHPRMLTLLSNLARAYSEGGKLPEAMRLFERVLAAQETQLGPDHPSTLLTLNNLALAYCEAGKLAQALPLFERAAVGVEKQRFLHEHATRILPNTIYAYEDAECWDKAEVWRHKWLAVVKERTGADHPTYADELLELGLNLLAQKKWSEAEAALRDCLAIRQKKEPDAWTTFNTMSLLGSALLEQKKYADAELLLLQGHEGMKQRAEKIPAPTKVRLTEALERLVQLYEAMGKKEEAAKWRKELAASQATSKSPGK